MNTRLEGKRLPQDVPYETLQRVTSGAANSPVTVLGKECAFLNHGCHFGAKFPLSAKN